MSISVQIPDSVLEQLVEAAKADGITPAEWIQARLPKNSGQHRVPTPEEIAEADARLERCIVNLGYATGTDNEQIDADLAREYLDTHEDSCSAGKK